MDSPARARRGAALLVALFTIAILASVTAMASSRARQGAAVVDNRRSQATARAMAESGILAGRRRIEAALRTVGDDSVRAETLFDELMTSTEPLVADTLAEGIFATTVVDVSARLDVNLAGVEGMARMLATVAPAAESREVAARLEAHVRGDDLPADAGLELRRQRDSVSAALLGRDQAPRAMHPFLSLDELLTVPGMRPEWLESLAAELTVDGDGRINRRSATPRVLASATGTLVNRPSRILLVARGWRVDHVLTREIQAVFDVNGTELRLVRWREQDR